MFNVNQQLIRLLCRVGFVLFCAAPTVTTLGWTLLVGRTIFTQAEQTACKQALSTQLGLQVDFTDMSRDIGGAIVLSNLRISDPETRAEILRAKTVQAEQGSRGLVLVCSYVEANTDQLASDWRTLHEGLLRRRISLPGDLFIVADRISFVRRGRGDQSQRAETFTDVSCELLQHERGADFSARFRRAGEANSKLAELHIKRTIESATTQTRVSLNTHRTAMPCWLLSEEFSGLKNLGEDCQFAGKLWVQGLGANWEGDVGGRFTNVDLERYVGSQFPHRLSGRAELVLDPPAKFREGRLAEAIGILRSPRGTIGRELLKAASDQLDLEWTRDAGRNGLYTELAIGFRMTSQGLSISGLCDSPGAIVVDSQGPLLVEQDRRPVPVVNLVSALVPTSNTQAPATEETVPLMQVLPIPSVAPPSALRVERPSAKVWLQR